MKVKQQENLLTLHVQGALSVHFQFDRDRAKSQKWQVNTTLGSLTVSVTGKSFCQFSDFSITKLTDNAP